MLTTTYTDEDMLPLSGIQHYSFCPRQWALIHIEQIWTENHLTKEGDFLHANIDNPFLRETKGSDVISLHGLRIASYRLGISGIADVVELHPTCQDAPRNKKQLIKSRLFKALPIEYKRGNKKISNCDRLQVTAQAMLLEEMWSIKIDKGAIFYWQERHREYFDITEDLRLEVETTCKSMHQLMKSGTTPRLSKKVGCKSCSLINECLPGLSNKKVKQYIDGYLNEETT